MISGQTTAVWVVRYRAVGRSMIAAEMLCSVRLVLKSSVSQHQSYAAAISGVRIHAANQRSSSRARHTMPALRN